MGPDHAQPSEVKVKLEHYDVDHTPKTGSDYMMTDYGLVKITRNYMWEAFQRGMTLGQVCTEVAKYSWNCGYCEPFDKDLRNGS